jgi:hypothetical protein
VFALAYGINEHVKWHPLSFASLWLSIVKPVEKPLKVLIVKSLIQAVVVAAILATPVAVFAQADQPLTRAQVREQLVQIEKAGYNPSRSNPNEYPADIQAAEARVAAQNAALGGVVSGSSEQGKVSLAK